MIEGDALDFEQQGLASVFKVVANIPYYITGAIMRKFLEAEYQPASMTLLVQKEVAQRIVVSDGKESKLSLSVKAYGQAHIAMPVPARFFSPKPKVDSAVIHIANISRNFFDVIDERRFFKLINAGFAHKRKKLISNLAGFATKDNLLKIFSAIGLSENTRAESVSLESWKFIVKSLALS